MDGNNRPRRHRPAAGSVGRHQPEADRRACAPRATIKPTKPTSCRIALLDAIERAAIRDKLLPIEVFEAVRPQFPQYEPQQLGTWVERFFRLWCRNQWKRERYAPSFHLDDENLDPKTWCRFPILNSGFDKELADLREYLTRNRKSRDRTEYRRSQKPIAGELRLAGIQPA